MKRRAAIKNMLALGASTIYLPLIGYAQSSPIVVTPATFGSVIALGGVPPGTVLELQPGDYDLSGAAWLCKVSGTAAQPITFRGQPGVRIGPIQIAGAYLIFEDCEIAYTGWTTRWSDTPGSNPPGVFYWARLLVYGKGAVLRRCIIHDLADVGWGVGASDSLFEDCLTYNIGWESTDRGHGHGAYIQNDSAGPKTMRRCVSLLAYATPMKIYGVNAQLESITVEDTVLAHGKENYTYVRSDNGAAHNITLKNIFSYGVHWQHMNAAAGGGPLTVDGGVIVPPVEWFAHVGAKNWQNGMTMRHVQIVARYLIAYWRDSVANGWADENSYHALGANPFATWAPNAGISYPSLAAWQAGTGNDANSTYSTGLPSTPRIEVIPRAQDSVVVVYNWQRAASVVAPVAGLYVNAMNRAESVQLAAGAPLPMDGWTVAPPIGASTPLAAWDRQFSVFLVEP